ncbi:hypothetical protein BDR03DRAFT_935640 [Suillus americanus]|nr:hypothetical protein BDR03DRAFT_935640 [Suillus americanus]
MKIVVVGSGVSSLAATWALNEHIPHEVHLYEVEDRAGGHTNTIGYIHPGKSDGCVVGMDTSSSTRPHPNFLLFILRIFAIRILQTELTFSVYGDSGIFECAGKILATLFCRPSRLLDPDMWQLICDVLGFDAYLFVGDHLDREGYSASFRDNYLTGTPPEKCLMNFPAWTLADAICVDEEDILKSFEWNTNVAALHSNIDLMLKARNAWSRWNYLTFFSSNDKATHNANIKQSRVDLHGPVLATLNPPIDPGVIKPAARFAYEHSILDINAPIIARKAMTNIQCCGGVLFAGTWLRYGFHEDGFTILINDVQLPFDIAGADREPWVTFVAPLFG